MTIDLGAISEVVEHLFELIVAHGLVEAGKGTVGKGLGWLRRVLPVKDHITLDAAVHAPGSQPARKALIQAIQAALQDNPALLAELQALVQPEAEGRIVQTQTVGDGAQAGQNTGDNVTFNFSR